MIKAECICGAELEAAESLAGQGFSCEQCGQKWHLTVGGAVAENERVGWALLVESKLNKDERALLAGAGPIEVGKLQGKELYLPGTLISRTHCRLVRSSDCWRIEDQNSRNGVYVNYSRVASRDLQAGDLITIGEFDLRFVPVMRSQTPVTPVPVVDESDLLQSVDEPAAPAILSSQEQVEDLVDLQIEMEDDSPGESVGG